MPSKIALIYNEPNTSKYDSAGEALAVVGVLDAVKAVEKSLTELGYQVTLLPLSLPLGRAMDKLRALDVSLVFNLFEGFSGYPKTEAIVPRALSELGLPFTGCGAETLNLCLDKGRVKNILKAAGLPTPDFQILTPSNLKTFRLGYPTIVKPIGEDASHGMTKDSVVMNYDALERQVNHICKTYDCAALVERFADGREFNVTVIGKTQYQAFPVSEIVYTLPEGIPQILTFEAKWEKDSVYYTGTNAVCPANINEAEAQEITELAVSAAKALGIKGYARVDMRQGNDGQTYILEVNPNPDISPGAGTARHAEAAGLSYTEFISKIMQVATEGASGSSRPRPMVKKDKPAIMRILRNTPEFKPAEVVVAEEVIDSYLNAPDTSGYHILAAESEQVILGYICYGQTPLTESTWDIYWMAVDREKRGHGIGGMLLDAAEKRIKKEGGKLSVIETSSIPSYEPTRSFYYKRGYTQTAVIQNFYAPNDDKLILTKQFP